MNQRLLFLLHFITIRNGKRRLNIIPLVPAVADEIDLQLFAHSFAAFITFGTLHNTHIYIKTSYQQLIVNDIFHNMIFFLLPGVQPIGSNINHV